MNEVVLDLGFVAFNSWSQLGCTVAITVLYTTLNIIPAFGELIEFLKDKELRWVAPLHCLSVLVPVVGSLIGNDWWGRDNKIVGFILISMSYLWIISMVAVFFGF